MLPFNGSINTGASPSLYKTDSLNPDESDYRIIALPFNQYSLSEFTSGMRSDQYKLMTWNGSGYFDAYGNASLGKGYMFLSTVNPENINETHNECLPNVVISLSSEWTMMGNPYLQTINWSKIEIDNGFTGGGFMVYNGGWNEQSSLTQLRGALINSGDVPSNAITINNPKFNTIEKDFKGKQYYQLEGDEWLLDLELKGGNIHHKISQVGQRMDASDDKDRYDIPMLPSMDKAFEIRFAINKTRDIRRTGREDITWTFNVENEYSTKAMLRWSLRSSPETNIYLLDTQTGDLINMLSENSYAFSGKGQRSFKILKGSYSYISEQTGRVIGGFRLYPNPTRDYLYIESYAKIDPDKIKIYTVDGKEIILLSREIIKSDDLSQVIRYGSNKMQRGTYIVKLDTNTKIFVKE